MKDLANGDVFEVAPISPYVMDFFKFVRGHLQVSELIPTGEYEIVECRTKSANAPIDGTHLELVLRWTEIIFKGTTGTWRLIFRDDFPDTVPQYFSKIEVFKLESDGWQERIFGPVATCYVHHLYKFGN